MIENYKFKIFSDINDELENIWLDVENANKTKVTIFQTFNWQKNWINHIGKKLGRISIILIEKKSNKSKLLIPMIIKTNKIFNVLEFTGYPFADFNIPIGDLNLTQEELQKIFKFLIKSKIFKKRIDLIKLINQPENLFGFKNQFFYLNWHKIKSNISYKINTNLILEKDILLKSENKFVRQDIKRIEKKLNNLEFKICENQTDKDKVINFISEKKSEQYRRSNTWDLFSNKYYNAFFKSFINNKYLNLSYIAIGGKIIAAHYGFIYKKTFYYVFPVYDFDKKNLSPGNLLLYRLINFYINKINWFDFTVGDEKYKKKWSNYSLDMSDNLKVINFKGFIYLIYLKFLKLLSSNAKLKKFIKYIYFKIK